MSITDTFALPRCAETSLRLPVGAWEYRRETALLAITTLVAAGWRIVWQDADSALLKYTHKEVIQ